jgi:hypothetical protein
MLSSRFAYFRWMRLSVFPLSNVMSCLSFFFRHSHIITPNKDSPGCLSLV